MYQIKDVTTKHYALCVVDLFSFFSLPCTDSSLGLMLIITVKIYRIKIQHPELKLQMCLLRY